MAALAAASPGQGGAAPSADCTVGGPCSELAIAGDLPATLPDGQPSPSRGFADPSLRADPSGKKIWMSYSWPYTVPTGPARPTAVENHLAVSRDRGRTWTLVGPLWTATPTADPITGEPGRWNSEAVGLEVRGSAGDARWYSVRDTYVIDDDGSFRLVSYHLKIATARRPTELAGAAEQSLGGALTPASVPVDVKLASLSPKLAGCTFRDAGLHFERGRLFLATQCSLYTPAGEDYAGEFIAVFSTTPKGPVTGWQWRYRGKLAGDADAVALGGRTLQQTDLVENRNGSLLALVSPAGPGGGALSAHFGCRAVKVASLAPPRLQRSDAGRLRVTATVISSDSTPDGPGSCGYAAASRTGIVIAHRILQPRIVTALYASRARP